MGFATLDSSNQIQSTQLTTTLKGVECKDKLQSLQCGAVEGGMECVGVNPSLTPTPSAKETSTPPFGIFDLAHL